MSSPDHSERLSRTALKFSIFWVVFSRVFKKTSGPNFWVWADKKVEHSVQKFFYKLWKEVTQKLQISVWFC